LSPLQQGQEPEEEKKIIRFPVNFVTWTVQLPILAQPITYFGDINLKI
jgi:hypothetical protein